MNHIDEMINNDGLTGLKTSFEDEGASYRDVNDILDICRRHNLYSTIKIGGCEAKTNALNCRDLDVKGIVAPMVETPYAFKKFKMMCGQVFKDELPLHDFYVNIETETAIKNLDKILMLNNGFLKGVVFGRSDIVGSLGLAKDSVDSDEVCNLIRPALKLAKDNGLTTALGGNLTSKSESFIMTLFSDGLLDKVETRLAICTLKHLNDNYESFIDNAIELEKLVLQKRIDRLQHEMLPWTERCEAIHSRASSSR
jgi:hypothetical protein